MRRNDSCNDNPPAGMDRGRGREINRKTKRARIEMNVEVEMQ